MKTAAQSVLFVCVCLSQCASVCLHKALDLRTPKMQNYQNNAKRLCEPSTTNRHTHTTPRSNNQNKSHVYVAHTLCVWLALSLSFSHAALSPNKAKSKTRSKTTFESSAFALCHAKQKCTTAAAQQLLNYSYCILYLVSQAKLKL